MKISLNMGLGNTLGQLAMGMKFGMGGAGTGRGVAGRGSGGYNGGQSPYGLYGTEQLGGKTRESSGGGRRDAKAKSSPQKPDPLAGNIEEISPRKSVDRDFSVEGSERFMEEYRRLIESYFRGLAEEE